MPTFETFKELSAFLDQSASLRSVASFLKKAIELETKALCALNEDSSDNNRKDAEAHFLEEINYFIKNPESLSPWVIMSYRRRPKAWAVAASIQEHNDKAEARPKT